jgi:hypothetical protein
LRTHRTVLRARQRWHDTAAGDAHPGHQFTDAGGKLCPFGVAQR